LEPRRVSPLYWGWGCVAAPAYRSRVAEHDEMLDADAALANRRDSKRAAVIAVVGLATVMVASLLVVVSGISF
jgi:hypothetical protein